MKKFITVLLTGFFLTSLDAQAASADKGLGSAPKDVLMQITQWLDPRTQAALRGTSTQVRANAPFDFRGKIIVVTGDLHTLNAESLKRKIADSEIARERERAEEASSGGNIWFSSSSTGERTRHSREGSRVWCGSAAPDEYSLYMHHKPYIMAPNLPTTLSDDGYRSLLASYGAIVFQHATLEHRDILSCVTIGKSLWEEEQKRREDDRMRREIGAIFSEADAMPDTNFLCYLAQPLKLFQFAPPLLPTLDPIKLLYVREREPSNPTLRLLLDPAEQALRMLP